MSEQKKHIDDLFREKMGSHTEAPPSFVWKNLEQKLDSTVTPGNVVSYYKWLRYGVILSALVVLVYFSGRKLMDTSDTKQTAGEQVAAADLPQNNTGIDAGNAVAGSNEANTAVNETADNNTPAKTNENSVNNTNNAQEQAIQTGNAAARNIEAGNSRLLAANNTTSTTETKTNSKTNTATNSTAYAAGSKPVAQTAKTPASDPQADQKLAQTNSNSIKASTSKAPLLASNHSATATASKAANVGSPVIAANTARAADGNKTAKHSNAPVSRINRSNMQAYAAKANKEEYSQNSLRNDRDAHSDKTAKSNIHLASETDKQENTAAAANAYTKPHIENNIGAPHGRNNNHPGDNAYAATKRNTVAADAKAVTNNKIEAVDAGLAAKGNKELDKGAASAVKNTLEISESNIEATASAAKAGNSTAEANAAKAAPQETGSNTAAAKNNLPQTGNSINAGAATNSNVAMTGNNTAATNFKNTSGTQKNIEPAAANTATKAVANKPVSTTEFIDKLVAKNDNNRRVRRIPVFESGFKLGYELGFQHYAANKYVIAPYVEYSIGKVGVMIQPAFKFARNTHTHNLGETKNYYNVTQDPMIANRLPDAIQPNDTNHAYDMRIRTYIYTETHDSIVVNHHIETKSFTEIDLPILFKYNPTNNLSVYGGVLFNYSNSVIQIKEDKSSYSHTNEYTYRDSIILANPEPDPPTANTLFKYSGASYIKEYSNADYLSANSMKLNIGYMLGFSYTIKDRFLLDVSLQQNLSNMNYVPNKDVRGIYTQPYMRISAGYKLFKSKR